MAVVLEPLGEGAGVDVLVLERLVRGLERLVGLGELGVGGGGGGVLEEEVLVLALEGAVPGLQEDLSVELGFQVLVGAREGVVLGLERAVLQEEVLVGAQERLKLGLERGVPQQQVLVLERVVRDFEVVVESVVLGLERVVHGFEVEVGAREGVEPRLYGARHLPLPGVGQAVLLRQGRRRPAALLERAYHAPPVDRPPHEQMRGT